MGARSRAPVRARDRDDRSDGAARWLRQLHLDLGDRDRGEARQLEIGLAIDELARRIERGAVVELVPVDTTIWLRSVALPWDHRDPADRVIVATALLAGLPILTKDEAIHRFGGVECIW